ncbi:AmmeMemoRadiSam system protein B [Patescibacteria group bacterium]|nr:AmmeMemoRadiSam system protein B [Patescibacteria group bacterium]
MIKKGIINPTILFAIVLVLVIVLIRLPEDEHGLVKGEATDLPEFCSQKFLGGITTHHDIASELIDQLFQCLKKGTNPSTIVVIGPNHYYQGFKGLLTADRNWVTEWGNLHSDKRLIGKLMQSGLLELNNQSIAKDHAFTITLPYIEQYFPNARVVPLLIKHDLSQREADFLIEQLNRSLDSNTFLLGSIDFSHYLALEKAEKHDKVSKAIIENGNLEAVYDNKGDDYFDSAPGIYIILSLIKKRGSYQPFLLNHANSVSFGTDSNSTTSYYSWLFN